MSNIQWYQNEVASLERSLTSAHKRVGELSKELDEAQIELESWRLNLTPTEEANQRLRQQLTEARVELDEAREAYDLLGSNYKKADKDATASADQAMELRQDLKEARIEIKELHHECAGLKEGRCFPCEETDKVNNELRNKTIPKLEEEIAALKHMLMQARAGCSAWAGACRKAEFALEKAVEHIEEHNREYHHITPDEQIGNMKKVLEKK